MFIDEVSIIVRGGKGGNGRTSFRQEKYEPNGGPDGGNGGHGGNLILRSTYDIDTLSTFRARKVFTAEEGEGGGIKKFHGKNGSDMVLLVPVGTIVTDVKTKNILHDFVHDHEDFVIAAGGRGGYGNEHFKTSTRQAPKFSEYGDRGDEKEVTLTLKLVADIGIIGLPNAGKSTLISKISAVKPKIANYPFTTLIPHLGIVQHKGVNFVVSDNPGLIEGAATGKGLGIKFLKHIERTKILLHMIDCTNEDVVAEFKVINKELKKYSKLLANKEQIIVLSKIELLEEKEWKKKLEDLKKKTKQTVYPVSAVTGEGINKLLDLLVTSLSKLVSNPEAIDPSLATPKIYRPLEMNPKHFEVTKKRGFYLVQGQRIEQIVRMSPLWNVEALERVYDVLIKMGIHRELVKLGAVDGNKIKIGESSITFRDQ